MMKKEVEIGRNENYMCTLCRQCTPLFYDRRLELKTVYDQYFKGHCDHCIRLPSSSYGYQASTALESEQWRQKGQRPNLL